MRLYGLRRWVEQSYKQVKHVLGWSDYQVRSDRAIRRHWLLACLAFSFCWWAYGCLPASPDEPAEHQEGDLPAGSSGSAERENPGVLARNLESGKGMAGALCDAMALLEGLLRSAPAS